VWRETGIVKEFEHDRLPLEWSVEIGPGYSGPTVADDRVYVTDRLTEPEQVERVLCFDAKTGHELWKFEYPCEYTISYTAGPRACVTVHDKNAYALGAQGHLHCLDSATGRVLWKRDLAKDFSIRMPIWGIAAAPLIYDDLVILQIGGDDGACLVALDTRSGEEEWRALRDRANYTAPILIKQGGRDVCVCWTADSVAGLDPEEGEVYWRIPFPPTRMPIGIATPVVEDNMLFVTNFYDGALMLDLSMREPAAKKMWQISGRSEKETEALHSIISTPLLRGDYIYGVDSYGELRCLNAKTGERIWEDQTATPRNRWSNIHFVEHDDQVWMFNEAGELIIAELSPQGFREIDRALLIEPTQEQLRRRNGVTWAHPAFADRHVFARNDKRLVCASLEE
jgi:outer membrane protein assembly factor BamB